MFTESLITTQLMISTTLPNKAISTDQAFDPKVIDHFHASARLYRSWSREGHLHFGYWRWPLAPWDRQAMLDELVHQVVKPLDPVVGARFADLGCGYGASARLVARTYQLHVDAFTIVPEQVRDGNAEARRTGCDDLVTMHLRNMRNTGLPDASLDGVYALESWCYGQGHDKEDMIGEAARILRPGGRLSLMDGFIMKEPGAVRGRMLKIVEDGWAVPCFPRLKAFTAALERQGFHDIEVEDLSMRIAICAVHGPLLMLTTIFEQKCSGKKLDHLEWAHLRSCMLGILMGTQYDLFRYLKITATKPCETP